MEVVLQRNGEMNILINEERRRQRYGTDEIDRVDEKKNEIDQRHDGLDHEHETSANGVSIERNETHGWHRPGSSKNIP